MAGQVTFTIYPVANYSFGTKAAKQDKDATPQDRLARMEEQYRRLGQRRTVDAVLLVRGVLLGGVLYTQTKMHTLYHTLYHCLLFVMYTCGDMAVHTHVPPPTTRHRCMSTTTHMCCYCKPPMVVFSSCLGDDCDQEKMVGGL